MSSAKKAGPKVKFFGGDSTPPPTIATTQQKARVVMHGSKQSQHGQDLSKIPTPTSHNNRSRVAPSLDTAAPSTPSRPDANPLLPPTTPPVLVALPSAIMSSSGAPVFETLRDVYAASFELDLPSIVSHTASLHPTATEIDYWHALDTVETIFRLDEHLFVMQDWDDRENMLQIGRYYHIVRLPLGPEQYGVACTCVRWKAHSTCMHERVLSMNIIEANRLPQLSTSPLPAALLLHSTPFQAMYVFSCVSNTGRHESGKRSIVALQRDRRWHCQSCRYSSSCKHIPHAVVFAKEAGLVVDPDDGSSPPETESSDATDIENTLLLKAGTARDDQGQRGSVSHLLIPAPRWCSLPEEESFLAPKPYLASSHLSLDETAQCSCGTPLASADGGSMYTKPATLYDLLTQQTVTIEVVLCPVCRHTKRTIGPDLAKCGVFNWNNTMLFTHTLLNEFTSQFTSSETPFSAFCLTTRRRYFDADPLRPFCSEDTFVRVWFAFIRLQRLDSHMSCPTCGSTPDVVIADGISLGTHRSKLTASVQPPTRTDSGSEVVNTISSYKARHLPAIPHAPVRSTLNKIIDAKDDQVMGAVEGPAVQANQQLTSLYPAVRALVDLWLTFERTTAQYRTYRSLLRQIAAPDIVLQLVSFDAIPLLRSFAEPNAEPPAYLQARCPALGAVIASHKNDGSVIPLQLREAVDWLVTRAVDVYSRIAQHEAAPVDFHAPLDDWTKSGTVYGLSAVRRRRVYPKLYHDAQPLDQSTTEKDEAASGDCNKFYKTYAPNCLTGGILVLWCKHSICLGFHSIPIAEGRNDIFSAIYSRFIVAPKIIIYDFACQLAPYCLVREAKFFRNTRFLIDELHAQGHSRCGQACFASNWMRFDNKVWAANTSAAECGNKGMKRIRKSVSFMVYEHAIIFTKAFLDVWNREKIKRMNSC